MKVAIETVGVAALALPLLLAGCSDPKAANKDNFTKAIEPLVRDVFCSSINVRRQTLEPGGSVSIPAFPIVIRAREVDYGSADREQLDGWAKAGLLSRTESVQPVADQGSSDALKPMQVVTYAPTDASGSTFRGVDGKTGMGATVHTPSACKATGKVTEIVRWTEPASLIGQTFTEVTYRYVGADPTPIASKAEVEQVAQPKEVKVTLVRASDGWQPAR